MSFLFDINTGRRLSNSSVSVNGTSLVVGLDGAKDANGNELLLTSDNPDLVFSPDSGGTPDRPRFIVAVSLRVQAIKTRVIGKVYAIYDLSKPPADIFTVDFSYSVQPAYEMIVRDVTQDIFGVQTRELETYALPAVRISSFRPHDLSNVMDFDPNVPGKPVSVSVYAVKTGNFERAWLLMRPRGVANRLMIVISHGFGQNDAYYSEKGYTNPLSHDLLDDVTDRFILSRWGQQVTASTSDMALLMPVRAKAGGSELGPFIQKPGIGAEAVSRIMLAAKTTAALNWVGVVTFSSGIYDANTFIGVGGKGLKFAMSVNQDPAGGASILGPNRFQYLSGYTTYNYNMPGFEYLPLSRWQKDPQREEMQRALREQYIHTWAMPSYTLGMALNSLQR